MGIKLFVGGLSWDTTEDSLRNLFSQVGTVASAVIIMDKFSGKSKGFGFVEMGSPEEAQRAIQELNGKELDGRAIAVGEARPMQPRTGGGFGGGRGGFGGGRGGSGGGRGGDFQRRDDRGGRNW